MGSPGKPRARRRWDVGAHQPEAELLDLNLNEGHLDRLSLHAELTQHTSWHDALRQPLLELPL